MAFTLFQWEALLDILAAKFPNLVILSDVRYSPLPEGQRTASLFLGSILFFPGEEGGVASLVNSGIISRQELLSRKSDLRS